MVIRKPHSSNAPVRALLLALTSVFAGCSFAPTYKVPVMDVADSYKESGPWQTAMPSDQNDRGEWWRGYHDAALNDLEAKVDAANPDLAAAIERYTQARAYFAEARSGLFPGVGANGSATHNRQSDTRPLRSAAQPDEYKDDVLGAQLSYELDLWGRVRNLVAAGQASAQASNADLASVRLSLHAELANDYINLRGLDAQEKLLRDAVKAYEDALQLTQTRFAGGIASGLDVAHAHTQLDTARAQVTDVRAERALIEHAIASLIGVSASKFGLPEQIVDLPLPAIPLQLPSTLLERRPDIAAAERRAAAANANIGVARAAFFPSISLTAGGGYETAGGGSPWLSSPNRYWSIGPHISLPIFDAGRRRAADREAQAAFDEAADKYRSTTLDAFAQVEDNLTLLHLLGDEAKDEDAAVASAQNTLDLALDRYRNGAVNYLEVVDSQAAALQAQRGALTLRDRRLRASVGLIRALGGGWSSDELPTAQSAAITANATTSNKPRSALSAAQ